MNLSMFNTSRESQTRTTLGFVLTPGRFVGAEAQEEDGEPFTERFPRLVADLEQLFAQGETLTRNVQARLSGVSA